MDRSLRPPPGDPGVSQASPRQGFGHALDGLPDSLPVKRKRVQTVPHFLPDRLNNRFRIFRLAQLPEALLVPRPPGGYS